MNLKKNVLLRWQKLEVKTKEGGAGSFILFAE